MTTVYKSSMDFKIATEKWEFEEIHKLNYQTFVEEIPQHGRNHDRTLIDKFHSENTYIICAEGRCLNGMIAVRDKRPFSLDSKLDSLDDYLPPYTNACEIRLLSISKSRRSRLVLQGLFRKLAKYCEESGYDLALISATVTQLKLYKKLGFMEFGSLVGSNGAMFQPMYLTPDSYSKLKQDTKFLRTSGNGVLSEPINLLPGPVVIKPEVKREFELDPVSHRSEDFLKNYDQTCRLLNSLVGTSHVQIISGAGTVANDVVAAQLCVMDKGGLILSNGEFGERLLDQATRTGLEFETYRVDWGEVFEPSEIESIIDTNPDIAWVWFVQLETSTGVLNDLESLKRIASHRGVKPVVDCISSLGNVEVDLNGVYFATGSSGKGLRSYPGLSFVFYNHDIKPHNNSHIPKYMDLAYYAGSGGVPFTMSSNQLYALNAALQSLDTYTKFTKIRNQSVWLRETLEQSGLKLVTRNAHPPTPLITFELPEHHVSLEIGERLDARGYLLSYRSNYLVERNWIQISLMSEYPDDVINDALDALLEFL